MLNLFLQKFETLTPKLCYQSIRYRGKYNSRYPRPRHDITRYLEEITKPVVIRKLPAQVDLCKSHMDKIDSSLKISTKSAIDFEEFLAKHAAKLVNEHEVMLICHQNFSEAYTMRLNKIQFKRNSMEIWDFNTTSMRLFVEQNPKYKNLSPIIETSLGRNRYIFAKKVTDLPKSLDLLRKMPQLILLGGLITDHLVTKSELQRLSQLTDITQLHGGVLSTLNQNVVQNLSLIQNPLMNLIVTLNSISKQNESK